MEQAALSLNPLELTENLNVYFIYLNVYLDVLSPMSGDVIRLHLCLCLLLL